MTDSETEAEAWMTGAFEELRATQEPSHDLLSKVRTRMRARRRARVVVRGSLAACVCIGTVVAVSSFGFGDSEPDVEFASESGNAVEQDDQQGQVAPAEIRLSSVGSRDITIRSFVVSCQPVNTGTETVQILRIEADPGGVERTESTPYFSFQGGVDKLTEGSVFTLPLDDLGSGSQATPLNFEATAWFPSSAGGAFTSSTATTARGTVVVHEASCEGEASADIEVNLDLMDESGDTTVTARGVASNG